MRGRATGKKLQASRKKLQAALLHAAFLRLQAAYWSWC
jgi:hypothetical protein